MNKVLAYDAETNGLPVWQKPSGLPCQPHIVQLAAILADLETGKVFSDFNVIIQPDGWEIPDEAIDVHGITWEMAMDVGMSESLAVEMLLDLAKTADLNSGIKRVSYNRTFDQRIVRIALKRFYNEEIQDAAWAEKENHDCAMLMANKAIGGKNKLEAAYKYYFGKDLVGAHNAGVDAKACLDVYRLLMNYSVDGCTSERAATAL